MSENKFSFEEGQLQKLLEETAKKKDKGRLKIFLGLAAGVGKTYAMLEAAKKKMDEGVRVLVGCANTHGREETAKLLKPLEVLPEKTIIYREKEFKELDLEELLKQNPQLAIVDELAHTNIPGCKHLKRWQDVLDLLNAGIDVYTTLNIQHVESYKDIVERITGIKIRETVPDLILDHASSITCVDITPADLLQRLREGKVYTGDLSNVALNHFFQEDRLTALRGLALRCTADVVDVELHELIKAIQRGKGWKPRERLLVAINHHPYAQQLIRTARRLSFALHAPWIAIYVDNGKQLDDEETAMLAKNLSLARELGGEVITTQDPDIAHGIQRIAEQKNITQIIVGKSLRTKHFTRSPVEKLTRISSGIDVHIIRQSTLFPQKKRRIKKKEFKQRAFSYLHILFWVLVVVFFGSMIAHFVGYRVVGTIFLLSTLVLSLFFRRGAVLFAAVLFALIWDFYFIAPKQNFKITSPEDVAFLILFLLSAVVTGVLSDRVRKRQDLLLKKERSTQAIYEIAKEISTAPTSKALFKGIKEKLGAILQGDCDLLSKKVDGNLNFQNCSFEHDEKEKGVANWVFENGQEAGWSTTTLPSAKRLYIPLKGYTETVGILAFQPSTEKFLLPEESNFLHTVAQQLAYYLERVLGRERERRHELIQQIDQIYANVLQSISIELSRPLSSIQSSLAAFRTEKTIIENEKLSASLSDMERTTDSLVRIADASEAMAELSSGIVALKKELHDVRELIQSCLQHLENRLKKHVIKVSVPDGTPPFSCDFSLMCILIHQLLYNAIEFSPPMTTIEIAADHFNGTFVLSVSDEGKGIPEDMIERVFEKFYRLEGTASTGLGLGLSIVKSIAEIHNGFIKVQNRETGGTTFSLLLPIDH